MTKKHFIAIAQEVKTALDYCTTDEQTNAVIVLVDNLATYFRNVNGNFDRQRFYEACGID